MTTNATQSAERLESLERRSLIRGVSRFSIPPHAQHPAIAPSGLGTLFYPEIRRACAPLPSRRPNGRRIRPHRYPLLTEILIANLELEFELSYRKLSPLRISNRKKTRVLRAPWRIAILDSATRSSSRHRTQWHRHSCLCAVAKPGRNGWQTLPHRYPRKFGPSIVMPFLIETPRLEFPLTPIITVSSKFLIETK